MSRDVSNNALYLPTRICLFIVKWNISRLVTLQLISRSDPNGTMNILWIYVVLLDTLYGYVIFRVLATCYPSIIRLLVPLLLASMAWIAILSKLFKELRVFNINNVVCTFYGCELTALFIKWFYDNDNNWDLKKNVSGSWVEVLF